MQKNIFWLNVGTALGVFKRLCQDTPRDMKDIQLSRPCTLRRILPHNLEDLGLRSWARFVLLYIGKAQNGLLAIQSIWHWDMKRW